ncbi:uncharacterized protein [Chiloscyllium punctatum]|uniref:uncharacterized protein n=1 Tax=Chiloscyllium punctatum TaxID=137246 RepID=UPI003B63E8A6
MLRIFLTVSVLFGHQIAAKDMEQEVIDLCTHVDCPEPEQVIQDKNYKEMQYPAIQWIETKVDDMDLVHAMDTGLKILLNYSAFNNAEETIVPVTAPWGISGHMANGTISKNYIVYLLLVPQVKSPPAPTDPTVKFGSVSDSWYFVRRK